MNTSQLSCFLSLATYLNYARTAEHLHISQPAVTRQIKSLENELGVQLFRRSTRMVELTEEGKAFLPDARSIVRISERAAARFAKKENEETLHFIVGCPGFLHMYMMLPVLRKLKDAHATLHMDIADMPLSRLFPKIDDESVDIAVGSRIQKKQIRNCSYREILKTEIACVFSQDFGLAEEPAVTIDVLRKYHSILYNPLDTTDPFLKQQDRIYGGRPVSEVTFVDSAEAAVILAASGCGAAILPRVLVPEIPGMLSRPVAGLDPVSMGFFYKTGNMKGLVKEAAALASGIFSGDGSVKK